jgi:hypothetical protein
MPSSVFLTHLPAWQVSLRTIWEKYYEEAHAIMYVIDAATASSFEDSKSALGKVLICVNYKLRHPFQIIRHFGLFLDK